jgi:proteasome lid subunit RPN8/RPN11
MTTDTKRLVLPVGAIDPVLEEIRRHGLADQETGALLLTGQSDRHVLVVAVAGTAGIVRGPGLFTVSAVAYDRLFTFAEERSYQVRAMIHSHPEEAFLSRIDRAYSLRVPGFVSAVVPTYTAPPANPALWGWWRFEQDWLPCPAPVLDPALLPMSTVVFDEGGVREY